MKWDATFNQRKRYIYLVMEGRKIHASWYAECKQPLRQWRKIVSGLYPKGVIRKFELLI